ncbi:MAG TPA: SPOR domain-containing protein [Sulfurovum sp.]|nr:SPOR domain-containing protein [Sulfurovum sp.]
MNKHNLDDLIIGEPTPVNNKSKSLLAIIALAIIILLIGILLSKMILGTSEDDITLADNNQTEFITPELIPVDTSMNNNNELTPIKKEKLPEPIKVKKTKSNPDKPKVAAKKETQTAQKKNKPKKEKPAPVKKAPAKKPSKPSELFGKNKSIYYIQVGAFNKDPNPRYLKKIKDAGFKYIINKNEKTQRVRVGPYGSYSEAKAAVSDVNSSIGIVGFVIKSTK